MKSRSVHFLYTSFFAKKKLLKSPAPEDTSPNGTIRGMGTKKTFVITMEYLMQQSETEARELIIRLIRSELGDPSFRVTFDMLYQKNPVKCRVILKKGTMFTYEMVK